MGRGGGGEVLERMEGRWRTAQAPAVARMIAAPRRGAPPASPSLPCLSLRGVGPDPGAPVQGPICRGAHLRFAGGGD
jgi:hypothetical protein